MALIISVMNARAFTLVEFYSLQRILIGQFGGTNDLKSVPMTLDAEGNVYVAGARLSENGDLDLVLQKYLPGGTLDWERTFISANGVDETPMDIFVDKFSNVYVTCSAVDLDLQSSNAGDQQIYTVKCNSGGTLLWQHAYDPAPGEFSFIHPVFVTADSSGNVYVAGLRTEYPSSLGGQVFLGDYDTIFGTTHILKYQAAGNVQWVKTLPGTSKPAAVSVANNNVTVAGTVKNGENADYFALRLNANNGNQKYYAVYDNGGNDLAKAMFVEGNDAYLTGYSQNANGDYDYATLRLKNNGTVQWIQRYAGPNNAEDKVAGIYAVNDSVYVTGSSGGDFVTLKYRKNGNLFRLNRFDYLENGAANDVAKGIVATSDGHVFVTGYTVLGENLSATLTIQLAPNGTLVKTFDKPLPFDVASGYELFFRRSITVDANDLVYVLGIESNAPVKYSLNAYGKASKNLPPNILDPILADLIRKNQDQIKANLNLIAKALAGVTDHPVIKELVKEYIENVYVYVTDSEGDTMAIDNVPFVPLYELRNKCHEYDIDLLELLQVVLFRSGTSREGVIKLASVIDSFPIVPGFDMKLYPHISHHLLSGTYGYTHPQDWDGVTADFVYVSQHYFKQNCKLPSYHIGTNDKIVLDFKTSETTALSAAWQVLVSPVALDNYIHFPVTENVGAITNVACACQKGDDMTDNLYCLESRYRDCVAQGFLGLVCGNYLCPNIASTLRPAIVYTKPCWGCLAQEE